MPKLGELIRKRRKELGLKVYELANKVGVHPVYITQIEKHEKLPSPAVISNIEKALGIDYYPLYLKKKYPDIAEKVNIVKLFHISRKVDLHRSLSDFVFKTNNTDYKTFIINLLPKIKSSQLENQKLIDTIIGSMKNIPKIRKSNQKVQENYRKLEDKIIKLINP